MSRIKERKLNLSKFRDLIIYPFFECNLKCKHCFVSKPSGPIGFLKSPPDAFNPHIEPDMVARVEDWGVKIVTFLGGEPFLSSALPELLNIVADKSNAKICIYTNATLLVKDEERVFTYPSILEVLDYLVVSIEGDEFWTRRIRGKVFEKCMRVLDRAREFTNPVARMSYWDEAVCLSCGRSQSITNRCIFCGSTNVKNQPMDVLNMAKKLNEEDIPVEVAPRIGTPPLKADFAKNFYALLGALPKADNELPSFKNYFGIDVTCPAGWLRLVMHPDGSLGGCQWSWEKFAHVSWDDDEIIRAANLWVERHGRIREECFGCERARICRSSCKQAMDYKECPVRKRSKGDIVVRIGEEYVRLNKNVMLGKLKRLRNVAPGVC